MRPRVLLVDDEQIILAAFSRLLTKLGYDVFVAANGAEALHILEQKKSSVPDLDLVLADVHMPEMNGIELLRAIKSQFGNVRVVLMSAGGSLAPNIAFEAGLLLGADATLDKTLSGRELTDAIEALLSPSSPVV